MSTINEWRGDADAGTHRGRATINRSVDGALYELVLANVATVSVRGEATSTNSSIAQALSELTAAVPNVAVEYTAGTDTFEFYSRTPGTPLADAIRGSNPASSYVKRIRPGVLPVQQEWLITLPATTTGGTWKIVANFGGDDETTANINHNAAPSAVASALNALTTPENGDFTVTLEQSSPRTYRVRVGGSLAGRNITLDANGDNLLGNVTAIVTRSQSVGGDAPAVWKIEIIRPIGDSSEIPVTINGVTYNASQFSISSQSWWNDRLPEETTAYFGGVAESVDVRTSYAVFAVPSGVAISISGGGAQRLQEHQGESNDSFQIIEYESGSKTFSWNGQTSTAGQINQIENRLLSLSNIDAGDIRVYGIGLPFGCYLVHFKGNLANGSRPLFEFGTTEAEYISDGSGTVNDIHEVRILNATGGTYTLQVTGNSASGNIDYSDDDESDIDTAIEATLDAGETVMVVGSGSFYSIEYTGDLAETTIPLIVVDTSALKGGTVSAVADKPGSPGTNEQQMIFIDPNNTDGTYALGFAGQLSADIDHDETVANVLTAFLAVSTVGADNATMDGTETQILVEFLDDLGERPVELIKINQDKLIISGDSAMTVETLSEATGPNHWDNAGNWTLAHVPRTGETVVLGSGRSSILHGLVQACECTFSGTDVICAKRSHFVDGQTVRLRTTDTLPTAEDSGGAVSLNGTTSYYVVSVDYRNGVQVLKISRTDNGEPIEFTNAGTGTHRVSVQLAALHQYASYTGKVGQPRRNSSGAWIDSERYLQVDFIDPAGGVPNLEVGIGKGTGSSLFNLDAGLAYLDARVIKSATPTDGAAFNLLNDNLSSSELLFIAGSSALATAPDEAAKVKKIISFENAKLALGNVDFTRLENYGEQVEFTSGVASGSVVQMRNR